MHGKHFLAVAVLAIYGTSSAATLHVGPARPYSVPSLAASAAQDGDTVLIDAGDYVDCTFWPRNNLFIKGVGGYAHVWDMSCGRKGIWVVDGTNTTIENIEFSGACVSDTDGGNGAGIRFEGTNLTVRHCSFHNNQDGILTGAGADNTVVIEFSFFADNGNADGQTHNMYIGNCKEFTLRGCTTKQAKVGHNVKSRAQRTNILYNRILDDGDSTSRSIDIPQGGEAYVIGNVIQQSPTIENSNMFGYGLEGFKNIAKQVFIINNTFVNDIPGRGSFVDLQSGTDSLVMLNNIFAGSGTVLTRAAAYMDTASNLVATTIADVKLTDEPNYDYHLLAGSPAIDAGTSEGVPFLPLEEYVAGDSTKPRIASGPIDIGAFEFPGSTSVAEHAQPPTAQQLFAYPNPTIDIASVELPSPPSAIQCSVFNAVGERVWPSTETVNGVLRVNARSLSPGEYFVRVVWRAGIYAGMFGVVR